MAKLGETIKPKPSKTKPDKYTPERGTESDPRNVNRFVPIKDPSGRIADARRPVSGGGGSGTISGGSGSVFDRNEAARRQAEQQERIRRQEAQRKLEELAKAQRELNLKNKADRLKNSLIAREKIKQRGIIQNKGFTRTSIQRQLKNEGTTISELRTATRGGKKFSPEIFKGIQGKSQQPQKVSLNAFTMAEATKITNFGNNRLLVTLPNNKKFTVRKTGRVNVGKEITGGVSMVFQDGVLRRINGESLYEEKLGVIKVGKKNNKIISGERAMKLVAEYSARIATLENQLNRSTPQRSRRKLIDRIRNKNFVGKTTAADFKTFKRDIGKAVEMAGLTIATSLLNIGLGSVQLVQGLKRSPAQTIAKLPGNLLEAVKQDVARMSMGQASALNVALEWVTIAKVYGAAGRGTKGVVKLTGKTTGKAIKKLVKLKPNYVKRVERNLVKRVAKIKKELTVGKTKKVDVGSKQYNKTLQVIDKLTVASADAKALNILRTFKKQGGRITEGNAKKFIKSVRNHFKKQLRNTPEYKSLSKLAKQNQSVIIKLLKKSKIRSAKEFLARIRKKLNTFSQTAKAKLTANRLLQKYKKGIGKIKKTRKTVKAKAESEIRKFKSAVEYKKQLARARKSRRSSKARNAVIGSDDYIKAVAVLEDFAENYGKVRARRFIEIQIKRNKNLRLGLGERQKFIQGISAYSKKLLRQNPTYKKLVETARLNKPYALIIKKKGKLRTAKDYFNSVKKKIDSLPLTKKIKAHPLTKKIGKVNRKITRGVKKASTVFKEARRTPKRIRRKVRRKIDDVRLERRIRKQIKRFIKEGKPVGKLEKNLRRIQFGVKRLKRKVKFAPRRLKKKLQTSTLRRQARKEFRQTNKYLMLKQRPIRKVTVGQLERTSTATQATRFVDAIFNEMNKRRKISLSDIKVRQFKNLIKKRITTAIKRGDKKQIASFKQKMKEMVQELNKKNKQPSVKIVKIEKGKPTRKFRTIKDFESPSPKGTYQEVKVGNQVMLQEVKVVQKTQVKQAQRYKVVQVQRKAINLKPLVEYGILSISRSAFMNALRTKQAFASTPRSRTTTRVAFDSSTKQDLRVLQGIESAFGPVSRVAQDVKSRLRRLQRLKRKPKRPTKKKPPIKKKVPLKVSKKRKSKGTQAYQVVEKIRGKLRKLSSKPLRFSDAKDFAAYRVDNRLSRTAFWVPIGNSKTVLPPPKNIKGYYSKISRKIRPYSIRQGKKKKLLNGLIEKRKYIQDTKGEKRQASRLRKKRKITPARRKKMLANLKKARAARRLKK